MAFKRLFRWAPAKRRPWYRYIWYRFSTARAMIFTRWHFLHSRGHCVYFFFHRIISKNAFDASREFESCRYASSLFFFHYYIVTIIFLPRYHVAIVAEHGEAETHIIMWYIVGVDYMCCRQWAQTRKAIYRCLS